MRTYICNIDILCTGLTITTKGNTLELDEADNYTKVLLTKKIISPVKTGKPKKEKQNG